MKYKVEIKCGNKFAAGFGRFGFPGRIWVRGCSEDEKRVEQYSIGFVDLRY